MFKLIKVFQTSTFPDHLFQLLYKCGWIVKDGYHTYEIGFWYEDIKGGDIATMVKEFDEWLIKNGASVGETIIIEHG